MLPGVLVELAKQMATVKNYWVYILQCENNSFYTGYTNDLEKRFAAHLNGTASKYTRSFKPICIAQSWKIMGDKSLAMKLEKFIKKLSRKQKEIIIANPDLFNAVMQEYPLPQ
jgi:putative endonuclease